MKPNTLKFVDLCTVGLKVTSSAQNSILHEKIETKYVRTFVSVTIALKNWYWF